MQTGGGFAKAMVAETIVQQTDNCVCPLPVSQASSIRKFTCLGMASQPSLVLNSRLGRAKWVAGIMQNQMNNAPRWHY